MLRISKKNKLMRYINRVCYSMEYSKSLKLKDFLCSYMYRIMEFNLKKLSFYPKTVQFVFFIFVG